MPYLLLLLTAVVPYAGIMVTFGVAGLGWHIVPPLSALGAWPWPTLIQWGIFASVTSAALLLACNPLLWPQKDQYGGAHWATKREIAQTGLLPKPITPGGMIIGRVGSRLLRMYNPLSVLVFAGPGSGKTAGIVIPSILADDWSVVVHDPKGEIRQKTMHHRGKFSKIVTFAPGMADSMCWNPLSSSQLPTAWADRMIVVERLAATFYPDAGGDNKHWAHSARAVFKFWAGALLHRNGQTSLPEILITAFASDARAMIEDELSANASLPDEVAMNGRELLGKSTNEFGSVMSTFKVGLNVVASEIVAKNLSSPEPGQEDTEINLYNLRKECTSLYVVVSNADQDRLRPLLTAFFEFCALTLINKEPDKTERAVSIYLDEFVRLGKMEQLQRLPAISRSYRVRTMYVLQSMAQLRELYGKEGAEELVDTCSYHVVFSQNELSTAEKISKSIGNYTAKKKSKSASWGRAASTSTSEEARPLILPQEIMSLEGKINTLGASGQPKKYRIIVFVEKKFQTPIHAVAPMYFLDPTMRKMVEA